MTSKADALLRRCPHRLESPTVSKRFDQKAADALVTCVRDVEMRSRAELVIEVHGRSMSYREADARFAALVSLLALLFLLFSPWHFSSVAVACDVPLVYLAGLWIASQSDGLRRLFTPELKRDEAVRRAAAALFYERGLANTMAETGVLLYVSLLERRVEILADRGVLTCVPPEKWNATVRELHRTNTTPDSAALVAAVARLGSLLEEALPAGELNPDELSNAVRFVVE